MVIDWNDITANMEKFKDLTSLGIIDLEGVIFYPISVGKVWTKRGKGIKHRKSTKKLISYYTFLILSIL